MHDTHLFTHILAYLAKEEESLHRDIIRLYVSVSELGGFSETHLRQHFDEALQGTKWESLDIVVKSVPWGPEFEITRIEFRGE